MANTLARMERDELIVRTDDSADKRRAFVHLTPKARAIQADVMTAARRIAGHAVEGLSVAEQEQLFGLLARLNENLKREPPVAAARG
jgi:DNA-binding MarR family transcriptional regulator